MTDDEKLHSTAATLTNAVTRLLHEFTGRGATRARTTIKDDLVSVVLEETLTKGKLMLIARGRADVAILIRKEFQTAMKPDLIAAVERIVGRRVLAYVSGIDIERNIEVENFVLVPANAGELQHACAEIAQVQSDVQHMQSEV